MAPSQTRKRKSNEMEQQPEAVTPSGSPARKRMKITQPQKQALIDNLQLEITERARHLRAHYALQSADLRARIERRINRIPMAMRKATMAELITKYEEMNKLENKSTVATIVNTRTASNSDLDRPLPPLPQEESTKITSPTRMQTQAPLSKSRKQKSAEINIASDKENEFHGGLDSLPMPKNNKRVKAGAPTRANSRAGKQAAVLSPRSHNSRTFPRSPVKEYPMNHASPMKSLIARPTSPLKPASPLKSAASAATSAISASVHGMIESAKRGTGAAAGKISRNASREKITTTTTSTTRGKMLPPPRPALNTVAPASFSPIRVASQASNHSSTSEQSTTSTTTTVVTKPKRGRAAKATTAIVATSEDDGGKPLTGKCTTTSTKASNAPTAAGGSKKTANTKKVVVAEPATGRRVLRKRN